MAPSGEPTQLEGLLHSYDGKSGPEHEKSSRNSRDDASRDSSDDDLDATDFLDMDYHSPGRSPATVSAYAPGRRFADMRRACARRSKCLLIFCGVFAVLWAITAGGGFWLYKKSPADGQSPPWYPTPPGGTVAQWASSYKKAAEMVKKMSLAEKVNITTGTGWQMGLAVGNSAPAVHVGFPGLAYQDGPLGLRFADNATAFPAGVTVGATWSRELMYRRGKAHGNEARLKGVNVLLGPCVGPLGRMPAGGRNWEGFGSDPYLQGIAGAQTIKGIQEEGVMATIKHFVGNEQEHFRQSWEWGLPNAMSSNIDDRTLHEMYGWPFQDAVKAGVASVMCSYQMVNNSYSCGNSKLLNGYMKDELGFQGFVQSDWLAQRSGVASALAGLDVTMPGDGLRWSNGKSLWGAVSLSISLDSIQIYILHDAGSFMHSTPVERCHILRVATNFILQELSKSVLNGSLPISRLNDMVTRVVASWYQLGQDDKSKYDGEGPNFSSWTYEETGYVNAGSPDDKDKKVVNKFIDVQGDHSLIARQVAVEGTVLLKNEGSILPLSKDGWADKHDLIFRVGIFGEDAGDAEGGPNVCEDRACNQGTLASGTYIKSISLIRILNSF